jgi:ribosome biogenesis GTPase A
MQAGLQWYPGHIAKYERQLAGLLKLVDVVLEVRDARLPQATVNPRLADKIRHKPTLVILNKNDLADPAQNSRWQAGLNRGNQRAVLYNARNAQGKARVIEAILALGEAALEKLEARGRKRRPLRVLVTGMPNVGKSTLINSIVGRKKVQTGHRAGVTTSTRWVRIHPDIELMDSPGIIPPRLDDQDAAYLLATVSSIGEAAFDDEDTARFLLKRIETLYPGRLADVFKLSVPVDDAVASPSEAEEATQGMAAGISLERIAEARHYRLPGGAPDSLRAAQALLSDFRHARLGRLTLEWPKDA